MSKIESVTQPGALWKAQLGGPKGLVVLVVQFVPKAQVPVGVQSAAPGVKVVIQPAGNAGAVTPSKSSLKTVTGVQVGAGLGLGVPGGLGVGVAVTGTIA